LPFLAASSVIEDQMGPSWRLPLSSRNVWRTGSRRHRLELLGVASPAPNSAPVSVPRYFFASPQAGAVVVVGVPTPK
jgi:hypothetical protein